MLGVSDDRSSLLEAAGAYRHGPEAWERFRDEAIGHDREIERHRHGWRRARLLKRRRLERQSRNCWAASTELGKHYFG